MSISHPKPKTDQKGDMDSSGEEREEVSLLSWLNLYQGFVTDTADLLKDELENIKKRKIIRNEAMLKNEKKPETVRLSKNIVTGINDAISKAVRELTNYGTQMTDELQKRFNLPEDWMQSSSTVTSMAGSEINGPTNPRKRLEMESRIAFLLTDKRKVKETISNNETRSAKGSGSEDQSNDSTNDEGKDEDDASNDSVAKPDNQADEVVSSNDDDTSKSSLKLTTPKKSPGRHSTRKSPANSAKKSSQSTPKKSPTQKPSRVSRMKVNSDSDAEEDIDMIPGTDDEDNDNQENAHESTESRSLPEVCEEESIRKRRSRSIDETPKKRSQESKSTGGSSSKRSASKKISVVGSPVAQSDSDTGESDSTCILPRTNNITPKTSSVKPTNVVQVKKERLSEACELPPNLDDNAELFHSTTQSTPKKVSKKVVVKQEIPDNEVLCNDNDTMDIDSQEEQVSLGQVEEPKEQDTRLASHVAEAVLEDNDDDFMNFLSPPRATTPVDFEIDLDETMTVMLPKTPVKSNEDSEDTSKSKQEDPKSKAKAENKMTKTRPEEAALKVKSGDQSSKPEGTPSKIQTEERNVKAKSEEAESERKAEEKISRKEPAESSKRDTRKSGKRSKEDIEAMKEILGSSDSDSDSDNSSKNKIKRKESVRKEKKDDTSNGNREEISIVSNIADNSWREDPKLEPEAAIVKLEKIPAAIEKKLAEDNYVILKGYSKLKRCTLDQLIKAKSKDSNDDSDDSVASNDSVRALQGAIKQVARNSMISTYEYKKKKKVAEKNLEGKTRMSRSRGRPTKKGGDSDLESSESGCNSNDERRELSGKPKKVIDSDIISCTGSEDLDADSDDNSGKTKKQKPTSSSSTRNENAKKKRYVQATISSSGSDEDHMKAVLGSDSDDDAPKKRSSRIKKVKSSGSDSDFVSKKKKRPERKKKGTESEASLISIHSSSSGSDSDSDFVQTKKSTKRRRDSSTENKKRKKRRRRIINNDSDASGNKSSSGSDVKEVSPEPGSSQKGRKKIRKILSNKELAKSTREAEKDEEERRKRLADKQNLFNGIHTAPESDKLERLILDVDPSTKEPVVEVHESIVTQLKPHQAEGIKFMYNACFESVEMIKQNKVPGGCILAHCMGLGKTLQSVAFVHTLLTNKVCGIKTALVICPLNTVNNWTQEFKKWTEDAPHINIHQLYKSTSFRDRLDNLKAWQRRGGVGILHYDIFRRLADPKGKMKIKASVRESIQTNLLDPGPDIVICDEGHLLKNCKSMLSLAVSTIKTTRRVVLTGTPLQNNLVEYHTMMNFVKPNLLGSLPEFTNRFVNPIKNGQHADSTEYDVKTMKRRAHVLHRKLDACVQRRDYLILAPYLPPKYEYIINIKLSEKQEALYKHYLAEEINPDPLARRKNLLKYHAELVKVWSHPIALTMRRSKDADDEDSDDSGGSIKDFVVDDSLSESDAGEGKGSSDEAKGNTKTKRSRTTRAQAANDPNWAKSNTGNLDDALSAGGWWNAVFKTKDEMHDVALSGKLIILQEIMKTCEAIGDKVLVFSQYLTSLDIIEEFLQDWDQQAERENRERDEPLTFPLSSVPQMGRWRKNIEYFRIDGGTKAEDRQRDCEKFNKKSSISRAKLFLISTRAGGLGINLFGANRVVIFDASWNPSQDMQSIFRVYRFGQDKPCYIYRLIARGTMEEKILRRQITKLSLSSRVVDEHQIERHFKFDDINEMYRYDDEDPAQTEAVLAVPKDRLLADLLMSHRDWIRSYEEFDSLLENKPDEGLSNDEKELAWAEYRIESDRQRQANSATTTSVQSEAETFLKVKQKLVAIHPNATVEQLDEATRTALDVIDKIRRLMHIVNINPQAAQMLAPQMNQLKAWLQAAVTEATPSLNPSETSILPPLPEGYFMQIPVLNQFLPRYPVPSYQQAPRPPIIRRQAPPNLYPLQNPPPRIIQNNFRNIVSNTLAGMRNYQQMNNNYHHMNGEY